MLACVHRRSFFCGSLVVRVGSRPSRAFIRAIDRFLPPQKLRMRKERFMAGAAAASSADVGAKGQLRSGLGAEITWQFLGERGRGSLYSACDSEFAMSTRLRLSLSTAWSIWG